MKRRRTLLMVAGGLVPLAALLSLPGRPARAQDAPRVIAVTARRFEYVPSQITLAKGETVRLQVRTEDVAHGLFLRPLGIDADVLPGRVTELTVTPDKAGTYRAICDHFCGAGHGAMKLTIVVEE